MIDVTDERDEVDGRQDLLGEVQRWARILRRRWLIVLLPGLLAAVVAYGVTARQPKLYQSSVDVLVPQTSPFGVVDSAEALATAMATELQVVKSAPVQQAAADALGPQFARVKTIDATRNGQGLVISISATSRSPQVAQEAADTLAKAYVTNRANRSAGQAKAQTDQAQKALTDATAELARLDAAIAAANKPGNAAQVATLQSQRGVVVDRIAALQQQLAQTQVTGQRDQPAEVLNAAALPGAPVSPHPSRTALLALVAGLLAGLVAAFVVDGLDDRVRSFDDVRRLSGEALVLGRLPARRRPGVDVGTDNAYGAVGSRLLRTLEVPSPIVMVSSLARPEDSAGAAAGVAAALTREGSDVALVDAAVSQPVLHDVLGLAESPGLTEVLAGEESTRGAIQEWKCGEGRVTVLSAGTPSSRRSATVDPGRLLETLVWLAQPVDLVLVQAGSPHDPLSTSLTEDADAVVVTAELGVTRARALRSRVAQLADLNSSVSVLVLGR